MREEVKKGKWNSGRKWVLLASGLLILSLIPLLWLGKYNVMCIDDYDYGRRVHDVWQATGSFFAAVQEAWKQNMDFYQEWQGTYVSCFLMGMCPMNFNYGIAWVVPVLMIAMFTVSTFVLGRHILTKWLGCEKEGAALCMLLMLFVFYQVIEAPFEGIYWYNGSTHYVLMQSIWFFPSDSYIRKHLGGKERAGGCLLWCVGASLRDRGRRQSGDGPAGGDSHGISPPLCAVSETR